MYTDERTSRSRVPRASSSPASYTKRSYPITRTLWIEHISVPFFVVDFFLYILPLFYCIFVVCMTPQLALCPPRALSRFAWIKPIKMRISSLWNHPQKPTKHAGSHFKQYTTHFSTSEHTIWWQRESILRIYRNLVAFYIYSIAISFARTNHSRI